MSHLASRLHPAERNGRHHAPAVEAEADARVPSRKAFPTDALPEPLRTFVKEVAASVGCAEEMAALPALVVAGAAVGATVVISPKRGFREPPALYANVQSGTGTGKTPAAKAAYRPAFKINQ